MSYFRKAADICWNSCNLEIAKYAIHYIKSGERVFMVAKDKQKQQELKSYLINLGLLEQYIFIMDNNNYAVITTKQHSEGYSMSLMGIMITSVYYDNQASREQLEGRLNEPNQLRPSIILLTIHAGILSYTLDKHESARSLSQAIKGYADDI